MKNEKFYRTGMSLIMTALLFVVSAVLADGQQGSDECAKLLARFRELDEKARDAETGLRYVRQRDDVKNKMKSLGCSTSQSSQSSESNDRPTHAPETEDSAAYTESPEPRYLKPNEFLEKVQPPDSEAEGSCGDFSGRWQVTTSEGSQTWEIWKGSIHPRVYGGRKVSGHGGSSKMLAALLEGNMLRFQFDTFTEHDEVFGGTYNCKLDAGCKSSLSPCKLNYDRNRRGSFDATFKWLGSSQRQ